MRSLTALVCLALLVASCARGAGGVTPDLTPVGRDADAAVATSAGLRAIAGGAGMLRVDWTPPPPGHEVVLYHATDPRQVYAGEPMLTLLAGDHVVLQDVPSGNHSFGLGVRPLPSPRDSVAARVSPVGVVLSVRVDAVIYVDAGASTTGADGKTPQTAFPELTSALAGTVGSRTILLRSGSYDAMGLVLRPGDQLFGGFRGLPGSAFRLTERDLGATVIRGSTGSVMFATESGDASIVLDGLVLDGQRRAFVGLDADDVPVELRSVDVHDFAGRGVLLQNDSRSDSITVHLAAAEFRQNGAEGLFAIGAYDLRAHACRFVANAQEGLDLDDLVALEGETASLHLTSCVFHGNGAEGMDADLAAPTSPGTTSGRFTVVVRGCVFARNGLDGLLLDAEYELAPLWSARVVIRDCVARDNGAAGIHIDDDGLASVLVHRSTSSANRGDGLLVTSETQVGFVTLSGSVFIGNLGVGARAAAGNKALVASHCVFVQNASGGLRSEVVESSATSCVAQGTGVPFVGTRLLGCVEAAASDVVFRHLPARVVSGIARRGEHLTLSPGHGVVVGTILELADDGLRREVVAVQGDVVTLDVAPRTLALPASVFVHADRSLVEDYRLAPGSIAKGAGLQGRDAGAFPLATERAPGTLDGFELPVYWPTQTSPAFTAPIAAGKSIAVAFDGAIDGDSAAGQVRLVLGNGSSGSITSLPIGDQILVFPPGQGWPTGNFRLEFRAGIRAADGTSLTTPFFLPMRTN